jgi:hypothetical protein
LDKGKNKKQVLNLYAAEINDQRRQMEKAKSKTARKANERTNASSSDEDNHNDLHNIVECRVEDIPKRKKRKVSNDEQSTASTEEKAFKDKIANLGQMNETSDESTGSSEDTVPP